MNSLTTLFGLAAQTGKGTPGVDGYSFRALSVDSTPNFEEILNQNHMIGLSGRATAQASIPERSGFSVPINVDFGLYPNSVGEALVGVGMAVTSGAKTTGGNLDHVIEHQFVKADQADAAYLTAYIKMGSDPAFTRQVTDTRLSRMEWTLNRQGATGSLTAFGLGENIISLPATILPEDNSMFLPFVGSMTWKDAAGAPAGSAYDFGCVQEQVITWDRPIEEDDMCLHNYFRSDNQELSFALSGAARGITFDRAFYEHMIYAGVVSAGPSKATLLTGITMVWETGANIPGGGGTSSTEQPYRLEMEIPKASVLLTDFRASGNDVIRANISWQMIDDDTTPPVNVQLENAAPSYVADPAMVAAFNRAGGNIVADWDATYWSGALPTADSMTVSMTDGDTSNPPTLTIQILDQFGRSFPYTGPLNLVLQNPAGATITPITVNAANGAFRGPVTVSQAGIGYQVQVTETTSAVSAVTNTFDITAVGAFDTGFSVGFA